MEFGVKRGVADEETYEIVEKKTWEWNCQIFENKCGHSLSSKMSDFPRKVTSTQWETGLSFPRNRVRG